MIAFGKPSNIEKPNRPMKYNIYYKGERIHENLSPEECSEAFQDLATQYYEGEKTDFSEIYLEEIVDG